MAFVRGRSLKHGGATPFEEAERHVMLQIGRLLSADLLINQFDRFPLVWDSEGNPGNTMLGNVEGVWCVTGVDQTVTPIHHGAGLDNYLRRVARVVKGDDPQAYERVEQHIATWAQFRVTKQGRLAMEEGLQSGVVALRVALQEIGGDPAHLVAGHLGDAGDDLRQFVTAVVGAMVQDTSQSRQLS
mmetsp:Transcript_34626/g.80980  ORF Transcript_34626/g.80980 Transcript_34626/m.80980 type:complete len:186 (+) Transcript_34626:714-1271(+)